MSPLYVRRSLAVRDLLLVCGHGGRPDLTLVIARWALLKRYEERFIEHMPLMDHVQGIRFWRKKANFTLLLDGDLHHSWWRELYFWNTLYLPFFILRNIYFFRWHTYSCIKCFNDILLEWEGRKASKKVDILSFTYYLLIILFQIIDENSIESQYNTHGS